MISMALLAWLAASSSSIPPSAAPSPAAVFSPYPWLYQRDGGGPVAEVIAVGDVMPGRGVTAVPDPFAASPWLNGDYLVLGNLEGSVAPPGATSAKPAAYRLALPETAVSRLGAAGFDLVSLANNHSLDYGPAGLAATARRLRSGGVAVVGLAGEQPHFYNRNGVRLAFLAFNAVPDPADPAADPRAAWDETALAAIRAAAAEADAVLVSLHWGYEYETRPDPAQARMAEAMRRAGADVIIGHHPHVVGETALFDDGRFVAYSLGNFLFDQEGAETGRGLALRLLLDRDGLRGVQALPLWAGRRPRLMAPNGDDAAALLDRARPALPRRAFACAGDSCAPVDHPPPFTPPAPFHSGQIDLTGDGAAETVRRAGREVVIDEGETAVWRSPPAWQVVDVALGDPNDDGRYEAALAIWQEDAAGVRRSQLYLIGHRGGAYQLLWGGRPLQDPIRELALGDVNGDGVEELIVLEAWSGGEGTAVSVWQWAGWTFTLLWRSEIGRYQDLTLIPRPAGRTPLIGVAAIPEGSLRMEN